MDDLIIIAIALLGSFVLSEICYRMKYPRIVGQITMGVILGIPFIKSLVFGEAVPVEIYFLSDLGIIFLLMLVGFEVNLTKLTRTFGDSLNVALFSILFSFISGFGITLALGYNPLVAIIVGVAFSLSAEATTVNLLIETATLNTRIGTLLIGVGIIDDLFGVLFLASLLTLIHERSINMVLSPFLIFGFCLLIFLVFKYIPRFITFIEKEHSKISLFSTVLVIGITITAAAKLLGFGPIIGAFIAGLLLRWAIKNKHVEEQNVEELKLMTFSFIIPFFFINIGMHFNLQAIAAHPYLTIAMIIAGSIGKVIGSVVVSLFRNISIRQAMLIGWGLNSRGEMELVIIEIARINGLIPIELYSSIVVMAVVTTLIFPFVLKHYLRTDPGIME